MRELTYFIGQPGCGKTTLITALTDNELAWVVKGTKLAPTHTVYDRIDVAQIGAARADFGGTDILPMSIQPLAVAWMANGAPDQVFAEGDRLANDKFFQAVTDQGWSLKVVYINVSDATAAQRRAERGSNQNPTWLKGRQTKVARLASKWIDNVIEIDGELGTTSQIAELKWVPVVSRFFG